jgi:hypothetical protein
MMEAARTSETLVNFYQTTRPYNPEDSHLHTHRRENLKPYSLFLIHQVERIVATIWMIGDHEKRTYPFVT